MDSSSAPMVSVVCPFYNEEAILHRAIHRMTENLRRDFGHDWELILVNDGSMDQSLKEVDRAIAELGDDVEGIRVVSHSCNQGRGRALKTGIDACNSEIIITTEIDCSWGDDICWRLYRELDSNPGCDAVIASPHMAGGGFGNVPLHRVLLTRLGNRIIRMFFESQITMNTGMTRAYRRHVIQPLVTYENGKEFHLEVILKLITIGFKFHEIPAKITWQDHKLAKKGVQRKSSTRLLKTISTHLRFVAIAQPVRYFALLSVICFLVSSGFLSAAFWALLVTHTPSAFFAIVGLLLFITGILLAGFSVIFFELREIMRSNWTASYPAFKPPVSQSPDNRSLRVVHRVAQRGGG